MNEKLNEYGVPDFNYVSLVRRSDGKEVYTSPAYISVYSDAGLPVKPDGAPEIDPYDPSLNLAKIRETLNYYFTRVNTAVRQQLESPKLSDEQKKNLKFLHWRDFDVQFKKFIPVGMAPKIYWTVPADVYCSGGSV